MRWMLAGCYGVQAAGIGASHHLLTIAGFALGCRMVGLLVGLPLGLLTALDGLGQIAGPTVTAFALATAPRPPSASTALLIAAASLLVGGIMKRR